MFVRKIKITGKIYSTRYSLYFCFNTNSFVLPKKEVSQILSIFFIVRPKMKPYFLYLKKKNYSNNPTNTL